MKKKKKTFNKKITIIIGIIVFALIIPNIAQAFLGDIGRSILKSIASAVLSFFGIFVSLAAKFFEAMLDIGFGNHRDIIEFGWEMTRNFSNMLFILFMIVIAFATILRIEQYGVKQLLPKVIMIALLINFSLVISYTIIDFSNILARSFINEAKTAAGGNISAALSDGLNLTKVWKPVDCNNMFRDTLKACKADEAKKSKNDEENDITCRAFAKEKENECFKGLATLEEANSNDTENKDSLLLSTIVSMFFGSIILMIAALALFLGGILLVVRLLFLWFLVIIVPVVFLCYIIPSLQSNWKKWWKTFLSWCFFAPIYSFFIWITIKVATQIREEGLSRSKDAGNQALMTDFFSTGDYLIGYLLIVGLLIGGVIISKNLGIAGAGVALNIANKAKQGTLAWAKKTGMRPLKSAGRAAGSGALKVGGKFLGMKYPSKVLGGKLGRRMQAKGFQVRQKAIGEKQHKAFQELLGTMSDKDVTKEMHTKGIRGFLATQEAKKRGVLREADRTDVARAMETMRINGASEEVRSLEELRPDAIKGKTEEETREKQGVAIERAISNGAHKRWSKKVLEKEEEGEVNEAINKLHEQLGSAEFAKVFKGWASEIQNVALASLKDGFTNNFEDESSAAKSNVGKRQSYASLTGKFDEAFKGHESNERIENKLRKYIEGWGDEDFKVLNKPAAAGKSREIVINYMKPSQVDGAATYLSGTPKEEMKTHAKKNRRDIHEQMQRSPGWGTNKTVDLKPREDKETRKARENLENM